MNDIQDLVNFAGMTAAAIHRGKLVWVVRCKECEFGEKVNSVYICGKSRGFVIAHEPDFYCADGRKRE